jgi:aryl-alcohol dehydrogenase-like predicted oxidoreductase
VRDDGYLSYSRADILRTVEQLQAIVTGGQSLSQAAIRYVLSHRAVVSAVPGASSLQQLIANIGASTSASPGTQTANFPESPDSIGRMLSDDELALIRAWTKPVVYDAHR